MTPAGRTSNFPVNRFLFARQYEEEEHRVRSDDPALGSSPITLRCVTCSNSNVLQVPESRIPPPSVGGTAFDTKVFRAGRPEGVTRSEGRIWGPRVPRLLITR